MAGIYAQATLNDPGCRTAVLTCGYSRPMALRRSRTRAEPPATDQTLLDMVNAIRDLTERVDAVEHDSRSLGTATVDDQASDVMDLRLQVARLSAERSRVTVDENIPGDFNIFEAARINSVPTIVYASTNHVSGRYESDGVLSRADAPIRPDGVYGAGKAFGEALGRFYSEGHGIRVLCLRIANCPGAEHEEPGKLYEPGFSRWLSNRDAAQLVWRCIETEEVKFGIFYGVSLGGEKKFDLSNAREILGYEPEDDGSLAEYRDQYS